MNSFEILRLNRSKVLRKCLPYADESKGRKNQKTTNIRSLSQFCCGTNTSTTSILLGRSGMNRIMFIDFPIFYGARKSKWQKGKVFLCKN
jgi:hypothetical protein